jgi:hypothetical protein
MSDSKVERPARGDSNLPEKESHESSRRQFLRKAAIAGAGVVGLTETAADAENTGKRTQRARRAAVGRLIVTNQTAPDVRLALKPGLKLDVISLTVVGPDLKTPKSLGARLCGGSSTCLALVELPGEVFE